MIYRARVVVPVTQPPIADGAVAVEAGVITAVGSVAEVRRAVGGDVTDLGEQALLPGLINAHCHLDYQEFRGAINRPKTFAGWIERINAIKRSLDAADYLRAIHTGLAECRKWGTSTVLNLEAFPELLAQLATPPIRTWWFYEMIDIRHRVATEALVEGALQFFEARPDWRGGFGLNPHAPYTASADLYRLAGTCGQRLAMPLTTHLAESREEYRMFREASGPLHKFLAGLGRPMEDCGSKSPFRTLLDAGAIDARWLLVHMNELDDEDFAALAADGAIWHIVHCPRSHAYFGHPPFPLDRLRQLGANLCLGTDSLASNDSLSMWEEMGALASREPGLASAEILQMATLNPARALHLENQLGQLAPGAQADLISVPFDGEPAEVCDALIAHRAPVRWMLIHGQPVA